MLRVITLAVVRSNIRIARCGIMKNNNFIAVKKEYLSLKIDINNVGFYNDPSFIKAEKRNPSLLDKYTTFVDEQTYSEEYLNRARNIIPKLTAFMSTEVAADGRLGACVDISGHMVKMLEELGIWAYCATGLTSINFKNKLPAQYFRPFNVDQTVGHQWIVTPPFAVIDVTLKFQPYANNQEKFIPDFILTETVAGVDFTFEELIEPEIRLTIPRPHNLENLKSFSPDAVHRLTTMKSNGAVETLDCVIRYGCVAAKFLEEKNLLELNNIGYKPNGKSPLAHFENFLSQHQIKHTVR